jgi:TRAP-type uncharacterized transport system substrate-binding protein
MADISHTQTVVTAPKHMSRHIFAILALGSLAAGVGLWYWFNRTAEESLKLGAGTELRYKDGLTDILSSEAQKRNLTIDVQWTHQPAEAVQKVSNHELDAAIIPAGLTIKADYIRQVTWMDPQIVHLFVKPDVPAVDGLAGLRGRIIFMGQEGTGVRCVADEILKFAGLTAGKDFIVDPRAYSAMMKAPREAMPDAVFNLSPLPSPLGEKLVRQYGYQLMELPMGEALALRTPCCEDAVIPIDTYGATPAAPPKLMHTVGVRGMLIAHRDTSSLAIERLLEVFFESDFARRANLKKMDPALIQRASDYRFHVGTLAYIHRGDPFHIKEVAAKAQGFIGSFLSIFSAIVLAWQWIRRKKVDVGQYQQECTNLDLDAQRAAVLGQFGEVELGACLTALAKLKAEVLEQYHKQFMGGDKAVVDLIARIEVLQHLLPSLVHTKVPPKRMQLDFGPPYKAA